MDNFSNLLGGAIPPIRDAQKDDINRKYSLKQVMKLQDEERRTKLISAMICELRKHVKEHKSLTSIDPDLINKNDELVKSLTILHEKVNTLG